jgi:hypothetical protein
MIPPTDPAVAEAFAAFPPAIRRKAMALRRLILETAAASDDIGPITETGSVRLNLQDVKTPMAGILRPSVHTTRPGRLRGSA